MTGLLRRRSTTSVAAVLAIVSLAACDSGDDRPGTAQWRQEWEATTALVPESDEVLDDGQDVCGEFLGEVRARREDLLPTPKRALDDTVTAWLSKAEAIGLDCGDDEEILRDRLEDLDVLASQVDAALETGGGG